MSLARHISLCFLILFSLDALGQTPDRAIIYGTGENSNTSISAPQGYSVDGDRNSTFVITYSSDFPAEAQAALEYAADIWSFYLDSEITIWVEAVWGTLPAGALAGAGPVTVHKDFPGAPISNRYYPAPLANALSASDLTPGQADISITFGDGINWYYGTNGNPWSSSYDFASVALHELGHGLGFIGSVDVQGSTGYIGYNGTPFIYDHFVINSAGSNVTSYSSGSALGSFLTGDDLYWEGEWGMDGNSGNTPRLFAPGGWEGGSSFSHLRENTYSAGNINSLMTPYIGMAEVIHDPGPIAIGMLADMGWNVDIVECAITAASGGLQLPCNPETNTYTQQVIIEYEGNPTLGFLNVNGLNHTIQSSPQTVTLVNQTATGQPVDVVAYFTNEQECTSTFTGVYVAANPCNCTEDVNGNGVVDVSDILGILSEFGCTSGCGAADANGDGAVNVADVLVVLSMFGELC